MLTKISNSKAQEKLLLLDLPPILTLSSTKLKLWRHIGQLFARSTQGFKQSLCRIWPQGRRCAIISMTETSRSWVGCDELRSKRPLVSSDWTSGAMGWGSSFSLSPRSPKQTIQVSGIFVMKCASERARGWSQVHKVVIIA